MGRSLLSFDKVAAREDSDAVADLEEMLDIVLLRIATVGKAGRKQGNE